MEKNILDEDKGEPRERLQEPTQQLLELSAAFTGTESTAPGEDIP